MRRTITLLLGIAAPLALAAVSLAQPMPNGPEGPGPMQGRGGRGGFNQPGNDPNNLQAVKSQIRATDEEWKVIGPKLRKVMTARQTAEAAFDPNSTANNSGFLSGLLGGGNRGGRMGRGGPPGNDPFNGPSDSAAGGMGFGRGFRGPGGDSSVAPTTVPTTQPAANATPIAPPPLAVPPATPSDVAPPEPPPGGPPGNAPPGPGGRISNLAQALNDLQTAWIDANTTPEQLQEKVAAVRAARLKARVEFEAAQKDLRELLTADQEAVLVSLGYLD